MKVYHYNWYRAQETQVILANISKYEKESINCISDACHWVCKWANGSMNNLILLLTLEEVILTVILNHVGLVS